MHWTILLAALSLVLLQIYTACTEVSKMNATPQKYLVIFGPEYFGNIKAGIISKNNVTINSRGNLELADKSIKIGSVKVQADMGRLVSWKDVEWGTMVPRGSSIVYRMHSTKTEQSDNLQEVPWSSYYPLAETGTSDAGIPEIKTRYIEMEIVLEGSDGQSPEVNFITFGYTEFYENQFLVKAKNMLLDGLKAVFKFFAKKEGVYTE